MEKGTFSDETVKDLVGAYFTPVKVNIRSNDVYNTDKGEISAGDLARGLQIRGVPAIYFFNNDMSILTSIPGYKPAEDFQLILRFIGEDHYLDQTFEEYKASLAKES
jgi:thioredoxin-related protein